MTRSTAHSLAFVLFLLANATMIVRPVDLFPALADVPVFEVLLLGACLSSGRRILAQLSPRSLVRHPVSLCMAGVLVAVALSHLTHMYLGGLIASSVVVGKCLVYYLLLVSVVDTPQRLQKFLKVVALVSTCMVGLCVADYLGWWDLTLLQPVAEFEGVTETNEAVQVQRLRGTGMFSDPNDISLLIVAAGVMCAYFLAERTAGSASASLSGRFFWRLQWLMPLAMLGTGLICTRSRGGLLMALGAAAVLVVCRYGRKAAVVFGALALCLFPLVVGRQSSLDLSEGTGQARIRHWRDGYMAIQSPELLFGIGAGRYEEIAELVAHNSYVHAFVELGLFGGTLFFGCFFFAGLALYRLRDHAVAPRDARLAALHPYLAAMLAGWCVGLVSLSRCYVFPTYMVVGICAAYVQMAEFRVRSPQPLVCWDWRHAKQLAGSSAAVFLLFYGAVVFLAD